MTDQREEGDYDVFPAVGILARVRGEDARAVLRQEKAFLLATGAERDLEMETSSGRHILVPLWGDDPLAQNVRDGIRQAIEHMGTDPRERLVTRIRDYCLGAGLQPPQLMFNRASTVVKFRPGTPVAVRRFGTRVARELGWTVD